MRANRKYRVEFKFARELSASLVGSTTNARKTETYFFGYHRNGIGERTIANQTKKSRARLSLASIPFGSVLFRLFRSGRCVGAGIMNAVMRAFYCQGNSAFEATNHHLSRLFFAPRLSPTRPASLLLLIKEQNVHICFIDEWPLVHLGLNEFAAVPKKSAAITTRLAL